MYMYLCAWVGNLFFLLHNSINCRFFQFPSLFAGISFVTVALQWRRLHFTYNTHTRTHKQPYICAHTHTHKCVPIYILAPTMLYNSIQSKLFKTSFSADTEC